VNKSKFLELVKNPELIDQKDLTKLEELTSDHPYSQVLHVLSALAYKSQDHSDFEKALNLAATYAYDRNVLRSIIEENNTSQVVPDPAVATLENPKDEIEEVSDFEWIHEGEEEEETPPLELHDVEEHLEPEEVNSIKEEPLQAGEAQVSDPAKSELPEVPDEAMHPQGQFTESPEEENLSVDEAKAVDSPSSDAAQMSTTESDIEELQNISESLEEIAGGQPLKGLHVDKETPAEKEENEPTQDSEISEPTSEKLLDLEIEAGSIHDELLQNLNQLQVNKQQYENSPDETGDPESRKEQVEIIDNFIKNSPVLSKPNLNMDSESLSQDDLSKKSTRLNDELASENLARIYLKQGKRKDAEKIYKKLIRKFPQKKAYFADQIRKLKKK
jgi:tetratricopeptide (TPR) repeat protein